MALVFRGLDHNLDREVAVKVPNERVLQDPDSRERFRREARSAAALTHPHIVRIYDFLDDEEVPCLVMELIDGQDLGDYLSSQPLSIEKALRFGAEILDAVSYAHEQGIIHRDLSPHNILIDSGGRVLVTDFGIARALGDQTLTDTGQMVGSVTTMSPEQAQGERVDVRSDLYSVGCLLYAMVAGRLPFEGDNPVQVALKHVNQQPTPPSRWRPDLPQKVEHLILSALAKDPGERPESARAMATSARALVTPDLAPTRVRPAVSKPSPSPSAQRGLPWVAFLLFVLFSGVTLWGISQLLIPKTVPVPDIEGQTVEEARRLVEQAGLRLEVAREVASETLAQGRIVRQSPPAGVKIRADQAISVTVSAGIPRIKLASLESLTVSEARSRLDRLGLKVEVKERAHERIPTGLVISQHPAAGAEVERGDTIELVVSSGSAWAVVPQMVGLSSEEARAVLERLGLEMVVESYRPDAQADEEKVLSQNPSAGARVRVGRRVFLVLSRGRQDLHVPELEGKTVAEAREIVKEMGLELVVEGEGGADEPIVFQEPPPGDPVRSTTVRVKTSPSTVVPVLQGRNERDAVIKLLAAGLEVGQVRRVYGEVAGDVVGQEPLPGIEVPPGTRVDLFIADPEVQQEPGPEASPVEPKPQFTPAPWVE